VVNFQVQLGLFLRVDSYGSVYYYYSKICSFLKKEMEMKNEEDICFFFTFGSYLLPIRALWGLSLLVDSQINIYFFFFFSKKPK